MSRPHRNSLLGLTIACLIALLSAASVHARAEGPASHACCCPATMEECCCVENEPALASAGACTSECQSTPPVTPTPAAPPAARLDANPVPAAPVAATVAPSLCAADPAPSVRPRERPARPAGRQLLLELSLLRR